MVFFLVSPQYSFRNREQNPNDFVQSSSGLRRSHCKLVFFFFSGGGGSGAKFLFWGFVVVVGFFFLLTNYIVFKIIMAQPTFESHETQS